MGFLALTNKPTSFLHLPPAAFSTASFPHFFFQEPGPAGCWCTLACSVPAPRSPNLGDCFLEIIPPVHICLQCQVMDYFDLHGLWQCFSSFWTSVISPPIFSCSNVKQAGGKSLFLSEVTTCQSEKTLFKSSANATHLITPSFFITGLLYFILSQFWLAHSMFFIAGVTWFSPKKYIGGELGLLTLINTYCLTEKE